MFTFSRDATVSGSHLEPYVTRWNSSTGSSTGLAVSLSDESFAAFSSSALSIVFLMTVAASSCSLTLSIYNNKGIVSECDVIQTHLRSNIFEVRVTAIKFLEGAVQLLTGLRIVVSGCPFHLYVTKHVLMCVCFGKIPFLPRILLPISLEQSQTIYHWKMVDTT